MEVKTAEPKKVSNQPASYGSEPRPRSFSDSFGGLGNTYSGFGGGGYGPGPYRTPEGFGGYGVGAGEFGGGYGGFDRGLGGNLGESSVGHSSRLGSYGGGLGGGYGPGGFGGYGHGDDNFGRYDVFYGGAYDDSSPGAGSGGMYRSWGSYGSGAGHHHPCAR